MEFTAWLGLGTLVIGVPLSATAAFLLRKTSRRAPHLRVLRERYLLQVGVTIVALFFGLIFVNNDQAVPPLADTATKLITRLAMLGLAIIPAVLWIRLYRSGRKP